MNNGAARHTPGTGRSNPLLAQSHRLARAAAWGAAYRHGRSLARADLASAPSPSGMPLEASDGAQILPFTPRPAPLGA